MELAVVFTEISCNPVRCDKAGKIATQELIRDAMILISQTIKEHGGKAIKTTEDQVLCIFPSAWKAVQCSCQMQLSIYRDTRFARLEMALKIGSHFGEGTLSKDNISGEVLSVARKLRESARSGQIIITRDVRRDIPMAMGLTLKSQGQVKIPETSRKLDLFEVLWNEGDEDNTVISSSAVQRWSETPGTLVLTYLGKDYILEKGRETYLLGRGNQNDLIMDEPCVSRGHAVIRQVDGKYRLVDQSTNGTYLSTAESGDFCLHQAEFILDRKGIICLGTRIEEGYAHLIHYRME